MQLLRSVAAIVAGFGFMVSTVMVGGIVTTALFGAGDLTANPGGAGVMFHVAAGLAVSAVGALIGGWLAARIAARAPLAHAAALAVLTGVLAAIAGIRAPAGAQPAWYPVVMGIAAVSGVLLGGKLRAAAAGPDGRDSVRHVGWDTSK
jgi:hypothetical protein